MVGERGRREGGRGRREREWGIKGERWWDGGKNEFIIIIHVCDYVCVCNNAILQSYTVIGNSFINIIL